MAEKDRISELPAHILDKILEFLPIQEAARTAVLSTFWKDIWFSLTKLNFDDPFFDYMSLRYSHVYSYNWISASLYVINKILMQHNGPIRKCVLHFFVECEPTVRLRSYDFDQWLLFLSRNGVEEIDLSFLMKGYRLPNCIFSCPTLQRMNLCGVSVELVNAHCVLPNVTSLCFNLVDFKPGNCVVDLPMLKNLSFDECEDMFYFNIVAPKLGSLTIKSFKWCSSGSPKEFVLGILPPNLDLRSISTLDLDYSSIEDFEELIEEVTRMGQQPLALNVKHLKLSISGYFNDQNISAFIHLLRICSKLCKLDIRCLGFDSAVSISEELSSVAETHKMLHTLKFSQFYGSMAEIQFIKVLLACFPVLEKVVIIRQVKYDYNVEFKIMQELLRLPRASTKAKIVYI